MKKSLITICTLFILILSQLQIKSQVALAFNGTSNYVSSSGSPVLNNQSRTVDAWINTSSSSSSQMVLCDWGGTSPLGSRFTLNILGSKLRIEVGGAGITGTTNVNTGQWIHVSAVYESSITSGPNVFLYLNGALEASGNFTGYSTLTTTTTVGFRLGARIDGINFYSGAMDEVKVYNYARTQAQIAADTIEYCAAQPGLVAYYKLNEGLAGATNTGSTSAADYSGNNNTGTLNSFTLSGTTSNWVTGRVRTGASTILANPSSNICSGSTLSLSAAAPGSFTWSTGNTTSTLITVSPTITTTYSLLATNSQSCLTSSFVTVTVNNALPTVTVLTAQNPICTGAATSFSATGAISYSWTGGIVNTQTFSPAVTTTYTLTAGNGCGTVTSVQTITVNPLAVSVTASPNIICQGSSSSLSASAAATGYSWSPGTLTGSVISVVPTGNTIYTVTASNGSCIGTQTVQVTTKQSPTTTVSFTSMTICEGQSVSVTASGAGINGTYSWSPNGGTNANAVVNPTTNSIFTAYGTNSLGCTSSAQVLILVTSKPSVTVSAVKTVVCNGDTVLLQASGAGSYTWDSGSTAGSTTVIPGPGYNIYTVTATASGNSCTATNTIGITVITPSVNYSSSVSICSGASATLTASGANTYSWNNVFAGSSGQMIYSPTITTVYTLTAKTQSLSTMCLSIHLATVSVNPNPTVTAVASKTTPICKGVTVTLTAGGANTYSWTVVSSTASQVAVTPSITTTYSVTGTSSAGCIGGKSITVIVNSCSGIQENLLSQELTIYPNPAKDEIYVHSDSEMTIGLYDLNGKLLKQINITDHDEHIDISDLSKGIYLLRGERDTKQINQKVIIE